ncbi:shikimate kinase [Bacillus carboniphilus]|uniref:Shikimate kinase n=1 Tax=Bacillus carboniphilus TaxID=86663 RepID=A0ABY9JWZ9_9BACI|nr:shikimate kinase [Bacillus carboniphilus]WLR43917.1 shikimate kinase [Bacillus carboniphilus]
MKVIYLTGFMGAGKSTIGVELAKLLNCPVIDTDEAIVKKEKRLIPEIFEQEGEKYFRNIESQVLKELPKGDCVVTTGGGLVVASENREYMKQNGIVIYLQADFHSLYKRIQHDPNRPLARNHSYDKLKTLLAERKYLYQEADYIINTDDQEPFQIAEEIAKLV